MRSLARRTMATWVFLANDGSDRLIVSTIRTRLVFFHEAGFEFSTERRVERRPVWWRPTTWRGFDWVRSGDAEQPRNVRCLFNKEQDPLEFGATPQSSPGYFRLTCDSLSIRRHCVWVVQSDPRADPEPTFEGRAGTVREIELQFDYDGRAQTVRHAGFAGSGSRSGKGDI
ncbi:MAG: hypothetical protein U1E21_10820 [Reyranellaceae bacterium]